MCVCLCVSIYVINKSFMVQKFYGLLDFILINVGQLLQFTSAKIKSAQNCVKFYTLQDFLQCTCILFHNVFISQVLCYCVCNTCTCIVFVHRLISGHQCTYLWN